MVERVQTGGTVNFEYKKQNSPMLKPKQKQEIAEAYEKYYERKHSEKRKRNIIFLIIAIIIIAILLFAIAFLRNS